MTTSADAADAPPVRYVGRIPVRNLWLLMLYASQLYRELPRSRIGGYEDNPDDLPNLLAEILTRAVERRMRRNLSLGYLRRRADLTRVRGRIDLLRTERRQLLRRGRIACAFDELTVDTPRNRYVKAALNLLSGIVSKPKLAHACRNVVARMERAGVTGSLATQDRRRPQAPLSGLGRLGADDRQMLAAARLAFDLALPTEDPNDSRLPTPDRDEVWARKLFERAVAGFYKAVLSPQVWRVKHGRRIYWNQVDESPGIADILPSMETDIELQRLASDVSSSTPRRIVIDTKFNEIMTSGQYGNQTLRSGYIYQIYAYLRSQEIDTDPDSLNSTGVLLHPSVGYCLDEHALIQGHKIRFATVNLAADTQTIRRQLCRVAD